MQLRAQTTKSGKGIAWQKVSRKREEEREGQCMNYTFTPQSEVPALFMSIKPTQLSQNGALSAVECNSSSLNT